MTPLQKILIVGAGVGIGNQIMNLFPGPTNEYVKTIADQVRLDAAENKRKLKAKKRLAMLTTDKEV